MNIHAWLPSGIPCVFYCIHKQGYKSMRLSFAQKIAIFGLPKTGLWQKKRQQIKDLL